MFYTLVVLFLSAAVRLAPEFLVVRVLDGNGLRPLRNAEVIDLDSGVGRFTDDSGAARVRWPAARRLRLRVRQLGFKPVERAVDEASGAGDTLTVVLERVAFALPSVVTREAQRCEEADSAASFRAVPALQQLRLGAERYARFRAIHPFHVEAERRTITLTQDGKARFVRRSKDEVDSDKWGDPYIPGDIVHRERLGFSVSILFLGALADSSFWTHHCFSVRGIRTLADQRVVEMEFSPTLGSDLPEWAGTALIDSATSMLRRIEFRLVGLPDDDTPRRFEGYTTFSTPSPYIAIPDSTVAYWWRRGPSDTGDWQAPDVVQLIRVITVRYRKGAEP